MVGFGDELHNFVLELTYNYGVYEYELGNDLHVGGARPGSLFRASAWSTSSCSVG